jgi:hypothetical protein
LSKLGKKTTTEVGKRLEEIENEKLNADANLKESDSPFWYHGIPDELLMGIELDLSNWSVVAFDTCIEKIGVGTFKKRSGAKGKQSNQIADLIDTRLTLSRSLQLRSVGSPKLVFPSVIHINLRGADHVSINMKVIAWSVQYIILNHIIYRSQIVQ